jgi:ADP-dependent NAD(P)H-hydrate dehydratase / NAD(P)H-hydrate epimerase
MKPVLTPREATELDRQTQARGVPADLLMERAGAAVARAAVDLCGGVYGRRVVVVCGKGNNGGDGFVAARHMSRSGMRVAVATLGGTSEREPAASNVARLRTETDARIAPYSGVWLDRELARADLVVDGIFGTGFRGIPEDEWAEAIQAIGECESPVLAIDIPSGVDGDTGAVEGAAVRADLTVTFGAAKTGDVLMPGAELAGDLRVVDIGFPEDLLHADAFLTEPSDVAAVIPARQADSHKRASGVLLVVAGSRAMSGAAALIAESAMRVGAGLVTVAAPRSVIPAISSRVEEATFLPLPETEAGTISREALEAINERLAVSHAMAVGPGLTTEEETSDLVGDLLRTCQVPMVVDADALNAFTGRSADLADRKSDAVLTPHAGEFSRLTGLGVRDLESDRLAHVRALAQRANAVTLLKGTRTVVSDPAGTVRINPTGSSILATAGSGDVLTGVIGGLLARGVAAIDAASAGAYIHGLAGILAGELTGEGTLARDLISNIPDAVARVGPA